MRIHILYICTYIHTVHNLLGFLGSNAPRLLRQGYNQQLQQTAVETSKKVGWLEQQVASSDCSGIYTVHT